MNIKEAKQIAQILFDGVSVKEDLLLIYPKIKKEFDNLQESWEVGEAKEQQRLEDYQEIGHRNGGRVFMGNAIRFLDGSNDKDGADREWNDLYGGKYPSFM